MLPVAGTAPQVPMMSEEKISASRPIITLNVREPIGYIRKYFGDRPTNLSYPANVGYLGQFRDRVYCDSQPAASCGVIVQHNR
jgi:hypothetical protein